MSQVHPELVNREELVDIACPLCGSDESRLLFDKEGFGHLRCADCSVVYVSPRLRDHGLLQVTGGTGLLQEETISDRDRLKFGRELDALEPYRRLNRFLDIGAGSGLFLKEAAGRSWQTWAVEINPTAVQKLARGNIHRIVEQPAETLSLEAASFDVVRIWEVIEHLERPDLVLERAFEALRPGGLLLLSTPNFASLSRRVCGPDWIYLNGADHIVLFEPRTLKKLLTDIGFTAIDLRTRAFKPERRRYFPPRSLPPPRLLHLLRNLIHGLVRFTPLGHSLIVKAEKPEKD